MALYDMTCQACDIKVEVRCAIAERESQICEQCSAPLTPLFSPPSQIVIPNAFHYAYSDLFGTSSEKDYRAANPDLEVVSPSTFVSQKDKRRRRIEQANEEAAEVERAILANRTLVGDADTPGRKPVEVETGSMEPDFKHKKV